MRAVELLRLPLAFGRAHAHFTLSEKGGTFSVTENGAVVTSTANDNSYRAAASKVVTRSGRHFVQFTALGGKYGMFGVLRPGWDVEGGAGTIHEDGHCFYYTGSGGCWPDHQTWEGIQPAREQGDRIGMLLDLDQGSMTVWKNDEKLGVMVAEGLSGPLCWAVEMYYHGNSARIDSAPAPASPTEEELELVTAKAWQVAHPPE